LPRKGRAEARRSAVFLDRDGTLNREIGHFGDPARVEILPGVPEALRLLEGAGFLLVVVTNQSAIARGIATRSGVDASNARLASLLEGEGVRLQGFYVCPHHPDLTGPCACRKPAPGLLFEAARDLGIDLRRSFLVGDKHSDILAGRRAGTRTVLLATGHGREEIDRGPGEEGATPDHVSESLGDAAEWILARVREAQSPARPGRSSKASPEGDAR
jgi:D-glycero-D-manno-heptose 1,7-bisphosphate phosphatase